MEEDERGDGIRVGAPDFAPALDDLFFAAITTNGPALCRAMTFSLRNCPATRTVKFVFRLWQSVIDPLEEVWIYELR